MALAFEVGAPVRQVVTPIEGVVSRIGVIDNDVQYCVEYQTADGEMHERFFTESEIAAIS